LLQNSRNNSHLTNKLSQVQEEQKYNDKPTNIMMSPNQAEFPSGLNLSNLVIRNENNQALFNKLACKLDYNNQTSLFIPNFCQSHQSEEFDKNRVKMAAEMAKDQLGCRLLQKWLDLKKPEIVKEIFENVIEWFGGLMNDPFGNYLCQKLIEISDKDEIRRIIDVIYRDFFAIAINQHGTRALQKLLENLKDEGNYKRMIAVLQENIYELINDNNGNHVIQKCLQTLNCDQKEFIYEVCVKNCVMIANHKHGFC